MQINRRVRKASDFLQLAEAEQIIVRTLVKSGCSLKHLTSTRYRVHKSNEISIVQQKSIIKGHNAQDVV